MTNLPRVAPPVQPPPDGPVRFPDCVRDFYPVAREAPLPLRQLAMFPDADGDGFADDFLRAVGPIPIAADGRKEVGP